MKNPFTREVRKYIYGVSIAALAVAVGIGAVPLETSALLIPLITAVLNLSPKEEA